ncbi:MAG: hypothetical protein KTR30_20265, partial [Saprospiraceae bacterium]|nr:hypothetical protein [Saprospiraceae bacterium]
MKIRFIPIYLLGGSLFICLFLASCQKSSQTSAGPYFGNGVHNGWADQTSISLWTRLTNRPDGNMAGTQFLDISQEDHRRLRKLTDLDSLHGTQIPASLTLDEMIGACPGASGEVQLQYYPQGQSDKTQTIAWKAVDATKDHTLQWKLANLQPDTQYFLELQARPGPNTAPSDTLQGSFYTAPSVTEEQK